MPLFLPNHLSVCRCLLYLFILISIIYSVYLRGLSLVWIFTEQTHKHSRNTVILVDVNDRAVSFCGQTDSRSPTRAVRLMNEILPQASLCQKSLDGFVLAYVCVSMCAFSEQAYIYIYIQPHSLHHVTMGVSGSGKPRGRDAAWESPWLKLYRLLSHNILNQKGSKGIAFHFYNLQY